MSALSPDNPEHPAFPIWDRVTRRTTAKTVEEIFDLEKRLGRLEKLEQAIRKRRGYYRGLPLDDPKSMHINATSRAVYVEICNLLEEAGLK